MPDLIHITEAACNDKSFLGDTQSDSLKWEQAAFTFLIKAMSTIKSGMIGRRKGCTL